MSTEKKMTVHPFSDLSRARPLFFVCHLMKYSITRESKNFEALRRLLLKALPTTPPPGPLTFLMDCLNVLYFLYEARCCGVLWHLLASVLYSCSDELSCTSVDYSKARKLADKLISIGIGSVHGSDVLRINEGILVKLATVFKIENNDLKKLAYTQRLRSRDGANEDMLRLARKGCWNLAEVIAKKIPEVVDLLVILALEMGNAEKAAGICARCCGTVNEIRNLEVKEFVSEENVIWVDTKDGLKEAERHFAEFQVFGIDSEWIEISQSSRIYKVSILQIATEEKVFIFDMLKLSQTECDALEACLQPMFHSQHIWKLGYALKNDINQLYRSYKFLDCFRFCEATLDFQRVYSSSQGGLSGLAENLLNGRLNKSLQMSDWGQRPLSPSQIQYAALDAIVLIAIFHVTQKTKGTDSCKSGLKLLIPSETSKRRR